jgi:transposase
MNPDELKEVQELHRRGLSIRAIARKLGRGRKTIRLALERPGRQGPAEAPKLERFKAIARQKRLAGLSANRILREIRALGYRGGLTLLKDYLATLEPKTPAKKAFRRFETQPGQEAQCDWSPYRVQIAGRETVAHCFSLVLGCSRRMFMAFYRNERLPTFLWAHTEAFAYLRGVDSRAPWHARSRIR